MSLILLCEISSKYREAWQLISRYRGSNKKCINEALKADQKGVISADILKDIAFTNLYKFVSVGRVARAGGHDRRWYIDCEREMILLENEISILKPEIIIFHGENNDVLRFCKMIEGRMPEYASKIHLMAHPADIYHNDEAGLNRSSLQYTLKHAKSILNDKDLIDK